MIASDMKKRKSLFTTRVLSILLFFSLLFPKEGNAQRQVADLRDLHRVSGENRGDPQGFYFQDRNYALEKFAGEWEGTGCGGYQWRTRIAVQKKVDRLLVRCPWLRAINQEGWQGSYHANQRSNPWDLFYSRIWASMGEAAAGCRS